MHATPTTIVQTAPEAAAQACTPDPLFIFEFNRRLERATLKALATIEELCDPPPEPDPGNPQQTAIELRSRALRLRAAGTILRQKPIEPPGNQGEASPLLARRAPQSRRAPSPPAPPPSVTPPRHSPQPAPTPRNDGVEEPHHPPDAQHVSPAPAPPDAPLPRADEEASPADSAPSEPAAAGNSRRSKPLPPRPYPFDGIQGWKDGDAIILTRH